MKIIEMHKIAAEKVKEGMTNDQLRKFLFSLKGAKVNQIRTVMKVYEL